MTSGVEEFDIPDDGGDYEVCTSQTKGFVLVVDKCEKHNHYIKLRSLNDSQYISDANTDIVAGTDINLTANENINIAAGKLLTVDAGEDITITETEGKRLLINRDVFIKHVEPPSTIEECIVDGMVDLNKFVSWFLANGAYF